MNTVSLRWSFGLALCALAPAAFAQATADISFAIGKVSIVTNGAEKPARTGDVVKPGEVLRTGPKSSAVLTLNEGTKIKVNENSEITGNQFDEGAAAGGASDIELKSGSVFAKVNKRKVNHFRIQTKTATMGVRGTEFFAAIGREGEEGSDVWLCVREGAVEMAPKDNEQGPVVVKEGQGVVKPAGGAISPPKAYPWTQTLNWNMNPGKGSVLNKTSLDAAYRDLLKKDYD